MFEIIESDHRQQQIDARNSVPLRKQTPAHKRVVATVETEREAKEYCEVMNGSTHISIGYSYREM